MQHPARGPLMYVYCTSSSRPLLSVYCTSSSSPLLSVYCTSSSSPLLSIYCTSSNSPQLAAHCCMYIAHHPAAPNWQPIAVCILHIIQQPPIGSQLLYVHIYCTSSSSPLLSVYCTSPSSPLLSVYCTSFSSPLLSVYCTSYFSIRFIHPVLLVSSRYKLASQLTSAARYGCQSPHDSHRSRWQHHLGEWSKWTATGERADCLVSAGWVERINACRIHKSIIFRLIYRSSTKRITPDIKAVHRRGRVLLQVGQKAKGTDSAVSQIVRKCTHKMTIQSGQSRVNRDNLVLHKCPILQLHKHYYCCLIYFSENSISFCIHLIHAKIVGHNLNV